MSVGDHVFVRNFSGHGDSWVPGTVSQKTGTYSYRVATPSHGVVRRHLDHVKVGVEEPVVAVDSDNSHATESTNEDLNSNPIVSELPQSPQTETTETTPVTLRRSTRPHKPIKRLDL